MSDPRGSHVRPLRPRRPSSSSAWRVQLAVAGAIGLGLSFLLGAPAIELGEGGDGARAPAAATEDLGFLKSERLEPGIQQIMLESRRPPGLARRRRSRGIAASETADAAAPPAAPSPAPSASAAIERFLRGEPVSQSETTRPEGGMLRTRVLKTDFKYPLVRVIERWDGDALQGRTLMVADHVMVRLREGLEPADLAPGLAAVGAQVLTQLPVSGLLLVQFDGSQPDAAELVLRQIQRMPAVRSAGFDYIATTR